VALIDEASGTVESVALPRRGSGMRQFDDARGNKADKLDFEACFVAELDGLQTLVAFGSGSTPLRESVLVLPFDGGQPAPRVIPASSLYSAFRGVPDFSGSELNVEGAVLVGDRVRFFQRGNGAPRGSMTPVNATCDVAWSDLEALIDGQGAPSLSEVIQYDLGAVLDVPLTFT